MRDEIHFPYSITTLSLVLKMLAFKYKKRQRESIVHERADLVAWWESFMRRNKKSKQCLGWLAVEKICVAGYSWWSYCPWGIIAWGHDKAYISQRQDAAAGTQTAEPLVILTACLFSFVVGEHEIRPSCTCYHLNYHCRWKILLINLINLNKKQGINTKIYCSSWENKASWQELSTENLSDP